LPPDTIDDCCFPTAKFPLDFALAFDPESLLEAPPYLFASAFAKAELD
jgi:hypothetical protein